MSFVTFAILVFAVVALILIVSRLGSSSASSSGKPVSPPVGPPCPNCGQPRGQLDRYCRRCGQQLSSEPLTKPPERSDPPAQQ